MMRENNFLQYFPSFLILIGVGLWTNTLFFSSITNHQERKLNHYSQTNFNNISAFMDSSNQKMLQNVETAILKRPADEPLLGFGNKIVEFQRIATQALDENLENADTNTYQIIQDFYKNTTDLLWEATDSNPIITKKEVDHLLKKYPFTTTYAFDDLDYKIAFQKNQVYQNTSAYINYLASKIGGTCICCFGTYIPQILFYKMLQVGKTQTGELFLTSSFCSCDFPIMNRYKVRLNGQSLLVKDRLSNFTTTFRDTSPQVLNVEYEFHEHLFKNHQHVTDTTFLREQFIIHPIEK